MCNNNFESLVATEVEKYIKNNLSASLSVNKFNSTLNVSISINGIPTYNTTGISIDMKYLWQELLKSEMNDL